MNNNYIKRFFDKELWKQVELKSPFEEKYELYISNYGRAKRITKKTNTAIIVKEYLTENYPSGNFRVMISMSEKENQSFIKIRLHILELKREVKSISDQLLFCSENHENFDEITENLNQTKIKLEKAQISNRQKYKKSESKRKKTFSFLTHRLVAIHFVSKASEEHNLVAHMDYDKLNNHHSNLKWMTRDELVKHHLGSPYVIQSKIKAQSREKVTRAKLTISQVMIIKKRINEGVSLRELAKRHVVTETQLLRIKRGENWAKIPAAL
jgi:HNH endonuclease